MLTASNLLNSIDNPRSNSNPYSSSLSVLASTQFSLSNLQNSHHSDLQDFLTRLARSNVELEAYEKAKKKMESDEGKWESCRKRKEAAKKDKERREAEDEERGARAA